MRDIYGKNSSARAVILFSVLLTCLTTGRLLNAQVGGGMAVQENRPVRPVEFLGWDYGKIGYTLNPGESIVLRFLNNQDSSMKFTVRWSLSSYEGIFIKEGSSDLSLDKGKTGEVPVSLPADLKPGPYNIFYSPQVKGWGSNNPFYFDYRKAVTDPMLNLNLVAMIENMDPEAWARLMMGPLEPYVNVWQEFPAGQKIDAVILIAEGMTKEQKQYRQLEKYINEGGLAIVFGKTSAALTDLLPVNITGGSEWAKRTPAALKLLEGGPWQDFDPGKGPLHYGVNCTAKPISRILAEWSDGTPAIVSGSYGKGKVVYVAAGSGQVWQERPSLEGADEIALRFLYDGKGGYEAVRYMLSHANNKLMDEITAKNRIRDNISFSLKIQPPKDFVVISRNNIGRFGWLKEEGGLVESIFPDGRVTALGVRDWRMQGGPPTYYDPMLTYTFSALDDKAPDVTDVQQNWFSKTMEWTYKAGVKVKSTLSLGSPAILWEGNLNDITVANKNITHFAYPSGKSISIIRKGGSVKGKDIKENWIIAFTAIDSLRDMPQLIVLKRRPKTVSLDNGIHFEYAGDGFGALLVSRLWGVRRLAPGETKEWINGIPDKAISDARYWSHALLNYPVDCEEIGWVNDNKVNIADRFVFKTIGTDWKTKPVKQAIIPPVYILAQKEGAPVFLPDNLVDLNCPTNLGPMMAINGDASLVITSIPVRDHRAIIPAEGKMIYQNEIDYRATGFGFGSRISPPGRNEGGGNFHADMDLYENPGRLPYNLQACIDPYKWWYTFNGLVARPAYSEETRKKVDEHNRIRYWETLNFYSHKCLVTQKREPFTGSEYIITFVWPTQTQYGFRNFNDANEASGLIAYSFANYARYYGDWTTIRANWNHCRRLHEYLPRVHDWACMASGALEYWIVAGLDMLNSEPYGSLAFAYAAGNAGFKEDELQGIVLGARSMVPTVARLGISDYLNSVTADDDILREFQGFYHFSEQGFFGSRRKMGGVGLFDTSKGTYHEFLLGYETWIGKSMKDELTAMSGGGMYGGRGGASPDNMMRLLLGWDINDIRKLESDGSAQANRRPTNWQSTTSIYDLAQLCVADIPLFLSEWAPAEYVSGFYQPEKQLLNLKFRSHIGEPFTVKLYSQRKPEKITVNGKVNINEWSYDQNTGWMEISLKGNDNQDIDIILGEPVAALHPYYTGLE